MLKPTVLGASRPKRQHRFQAVHSLDGRCAVHAEHGGVLWRAQMQADDFGRLVLELRIVTGHVTIYSMRLQPRLRTDTLHCRFADALCLGQFAATPVSVAIRRRLLHVAHDPSLNRRDTTRGRLLSCRGLSPSMQCFSNRLRQRAMVGERVLSFLSIAGLLRPPPKPGSIGHGRRHPRTRFATAPGRSVARVPHWAGSRFSILCHAHPTQYQLRAPSPDQLIHRPIRRKAKSFLQVTAPGLPRTN